MSALQTSCYAKGQEGKHYVHFVNAQAVLRQMRMIMLRWEAMEL